MLLPELSYAVPKCELCTKPPPGLLSRDSLRSSTRSGVEL
jgi:hypothetical protein